MSVQMPVAAIAGLGAVNFAFRLAGPVFRQFLWPGDNPHGRQGFTIPPRAERFLASASAVMLLSLAATSALTQGHSIVGEHGAGWARPAGVAVAGVLAVRRVPFPVVVIAAALVTALLRLAGVP